MDSAYSATLRTSPAITPYITASMTATTVSYRSTSGIPQSPALWQLLQQVARLVQVVQGGSNTSAMLADVPPPLRAGTQSLGFDVLRALGCGQWLCQALVPRKPAPLLRALLCAALALLWQQSDGAQTSTASHTSRRKNQYSHFTLVNQAVEAARRHPKLNRQANMVNAVLRRYLREQTDWNTRLQQAAPQAQAALLNLPDWWWQQLCADYGMEQARAIALAQQQAAPLVLRVNARWGTQQQYITLLQQADMAACPQGAYGVVLEHAVPVQQLPGFEQGYVSVQDTAAQLAAPLLLRALGILSASDAADIWDAACHASHMPPTNPPLNTPHHHNPSHLHTPHATTDSALRASVRLLDACAAPGGKTAHLLELLHTCPHNQPHHVLALEQDAQRCTLIEHTLQRLQLHPTGSHGTSTVHIQVADAAQPQHWWDGQPFDGILLDAPCTASGIVRRHPDVPWLRRAADITQLAAQQRRLLDALWPLVRPGGVLLYCTCSVFHAEGQQQIAAFLSRHNNAHALPAPGHLLPTPAGNAAPVADNAHVYTSSLFASSCPPNHDGFFYALLSKAC